MWERPTSAWARPWTVSKWWNLSEQQQERVWLFSLGLPVGETWHASWVPALTSLKWWTVTWDCKPTKAIPPLCHYLSEHWRTETAMKLGQWPNLWSLGILVKCIFKIWSLEKHAAMISRDTRFLGESSNLIDGQGLERAWKPGWSSWFQPITTTGQAGYCSPSREWLRRDIPVSRSEEIKILWYSWNRTHPCAHRWCLLVQECYLHQTGKCSVVYLLMFY